MNGGSVIKVRFMGPSNHNETIVLHHSLMIVTIRSKSMAFSPRKNAHDYNGNGGEIVAAGGTLKKT